MSAPVLRMLVASELDVAEAARMAGRHAGGLGFATVAACYVATAASELAANLLIHAGEGTFELFLLSGPAQRAGLEMVATDSGPGIADIALARREGYSTAGGLGCGLSGVQRLMDEMDIRSAVGVGTVVKARKWL
nr:ATP-binding protein [uncultured Duganella sp.]